MIHNCPNCRCEDFEGEFVDEYEFYVRRSGWIGLTRCKVLSSEKGFLAVCDEIHARGEAVGNTPEEAVANLRKLVSDVGAFE